MSKGIATGNFVGSGGKKLQLCITKPQLYDGTEAKKDCAVQAYFWLSSTSDKKLANMSTREVDHKGYKFAVLYNNRAINQHESLLVCLFPQEACNVFNC